MSNKNKFIQKNNSIMLGEMNVYTNTSLNSANLGALASLMNVAYLMGRNEHAAEMEEKLIKEGKI